MEYIQHALVTRTVDPHAQSMLATVAQEMKEGKLSGPYAAPAHWGVPTIVPSLPPFQDQPLLALPVGHTAAAVAFFHRH